MALDWGILHWIQTYLACPALDAIMPRLTLLGDIGFIWILTGVVLLCTKKHRRTGILLLLGLLCGALAGNVVLKNLVARPRPCWLDESVQLLIATPKDFSFPSGHTAASFAAVFALRASGSPLWKPALVLAAGIAFSRLYLYVHWPTDVLGGILVGAAAGWAGARLADALRRRRERLGRRA